MVNILHSCAAAGREDFTLLRPSLLFFLPLSLTLPMATSAVFAQAPTLPEIPPALLGNSSAGTADSLWYRTLVRYKASRSPRRHGFFVTQAGQLSQVQGNLHWWIGGKVACQLRRRAAIGLGGSVLLTEPQIAGLRTPSGRQAYLAGGYGGLLVEYTFAPTALVHLTVPVIAGAGGMGYSAHPNRNGHSTGGNDNLPGDNTDAFFVAEAGVNLEVNITRFLRFSLGGAYRYVEGLKLAFTTDSDLTGYTATAGIKVVFL